MKKVLVLTLSLVAIIALSACGGGATATKGQSSGAASAVTPMLAKSVSTGGTFASMVNVDDTINTSGSIPEQTITGVCKTSGNVTVSGSYNLSGSNTNLSNFDFTADLTAKFDNCSDTDPRCSIPYVLNGSIDGHTSIVINAAATDFTYTVTEKGNVNVALTGYSTFDCGIDVALTMNATQMGTIDNDTPSTILNLMTGTICGQDVKAIKTLIDSSDADYCKGVKEIAASGTTA